MGSTDLMGTRVRRPLAIKRVLALVQITSSVPVRTQLPHRLIFKSMQPRDSESPSTLLSQTTHSYASVSQTVNCGTLGCHLTQLRVPQNPLILHPSLKSTDEYVCPHGLLEAARL